MEKVKSLKDSEFKDFVEKNDTVLADFYADWCGPCKMISPVLEDLADEFKGKIAFCKLNVDENKERAGEFGIMSIPTLLIFSKGNLVDRLTGALPKETIKERLEKFL